MQRSRITFLVALTALSAALCATPAQADTPTSTISVSDATVQPGGTFQVTQTLYNPKDFTVTAAKAALYGKEKRIVDLVDLVSCTGTIVPCAPYLSSFRGPVGDLGPGETRTVVFSFRVKDDAELGAVTLQHQFVGDNYAFDTFDGPQLTIAPPPRADVKVALAATPRQSWTARVDYTVTVTDAGPATASDIQVAANIPAGRRFIGGTGCTAAAGKISCTVAKLDAGASTTLKFTTDGTMFSFGDFTTTVQRKSSSPEDPVAANDSASKKCTAFTGLLVTC
ncbi:MAG TPA: hypothetical protein VJX66_26155 [Amycolatopsis sp.]|nr:hypothetical protein [Amycolatopsis sp.]